MDTNYGNSSPPLTIEGVPENTISLALIMDDPDAMGAVGKVWVHWVLWNIEPDTIEVKENSIPSNSVEGETDFGEVGYGGPAPPDKEHTYIFKLYALDKKLELKKGSTKKEIEETMKDTYHSRRLNWKELLLLKSTCLEIQDSNI